MSYNSFLFYSQYFCFEKITSREVCHKNHFIKKSSKGKIDHYYLYKILHYKKFRQKVSSNKTKYCLELKKYSIIFISYLLNFKFVFIRNLIKSLFFKSKTKYCIKKTLIKRFQQSNKENIFCLKTKKDLYFSYI